MTAHENSSCANIFLLAAARFAMPVTFFMKQTQIIIPMLGALLVNLGLFQADARTEPFSSVFPLNMVLQFGLRRQWRASCHRSLPLTAAFMVLLLAGTRAAEIPRILPPTPKPEGFYNQSNNEMDRLAGPADTANFTAKLGIDWTVFTEDRIHPIRHANGLPKRWLGDIANHSQIFKGLARPGEFYVFQIGLFAARRPVGEIGMTFGDLKGPNGSLNRDRFRCFNLGGTNCHGEPFTRQLAVPLGHLQALWVGIDVPMDATGVYRGSIQIHDLAAGGGTGIGLELEVAGEPLRDHGDGDSWRLSRLRWLDSTIGLDEDTVTQPFVPIRREGNVLKLLGRDLDLGAGGLPRQIRSHFNAGNTRITPGPGWAILDAPIHLVIETSDGPVVFGTPAMQFTREQNGSTAWRATSESAGFKMVVQGVLEYDGFADFRCQIQSTKTTAVRDIRLEVPVSSPASTFFMGLGKPGGNCPPALDWNWNPKFNQDGFWIGAVNGGFKLQLYGANWRAPLINCYYHSRELMVPESWGGGNGHLGGIRLSHSLSGGRQAVAYSGPRDFKPGQALDFNFRLYLTPFKTLDTEQQWAMRYQHNTQGVEDADYRDLKRVKARGANVINIHHNKEQNPAINYPLFDWSLPSLRQCAADAHASGIRVKIYYTTRELTCNAPELYPFWSLNGEIICASPGKDGLRDGAWNYNGSGPDPWLVERLGDSGYIHAWREIIGGPYQGLLDLAVLTTPESRLDNFYLEGLAFLLRETGIDGVYIDDTALNRKAFQRAHRIYERAGRRFLADDHSWSHFNKFAGQTPSAYCYLQHFPYFHRLWYGEAFDYNSAPGFWLVEISGIPFGLMGEMLEGGGNKWRGMLFGMTGRLGFGGDPQSTWQLWDAFGMQGAEMIGFWDPTCPVRTGRDDVLATVYRQRGRSLVAVASWAPGPVELRLAVDWKALGLDPARASFRAPAAANLQPAMEFGSESPIPIPAGRGWLLIAEEAAPSPVASPNNQNPNLKK